MEIFELSDKNFKVTAINIFKKVDDSGDISHKNLNL